VKRKIGGQIARLVGGIVLWEEFASPSQRGNLLLVMLYWFGIFLVTEGGGWIAIRHAQEEGEL
jgi:hypothetical protein